MLLIDFLPKENSWNETYTYAYAYGTNTNQ